MTSVLNSMIAGLHLDERRSKENGQDVVRRSLYKYIYLVCGALVLGGLYRWNATLPVFLDRFSPRAARARSVKFGRGGLSKCCGRLRNFATFVMEKEKKQKPYSRENQRRGRRSRLVVYYPFFILSADIFDPISPERYSEYEIPR